MSAAVVALLVAAILEIGPPVSSARTATETVTAADGIVQSSVTGTGNVEPGVDDTVNFKTGGTLQDVYVSVGQHVTQGQLLAALDPSSAQLSLDQAQASLTAAEDNLSTAESGSSSGSATATGFDRGEDPLSEFTAYDPSEASTTAGGESANRKPPTTTTTTTTPTTTTTSTPTTTTTSTPTRTTPTRTHPATSGPTSTRPTSTRPTSTRTSSAQSGAGGRSTSGSSGQSSARTSSGAGSSGSGGGAASSGSSAGSIASDQGAVDSAEAAVASAEQTLADTKLYAPISGTIVSLASISPGDSVSAGSSGTGSSSSGSSAGGSSGSGATGALAAVTGASSSAAGSSGSGSSSSGSSSSSGFIQIINASQMTMTVSLSESDISSVKVGQPATVSMDALTGVELAAKVSSISPMGTDSDGVVSYDVTLTLTQSNPQVKPGMSASASIITAQASGVTLPNAAVAGSGSLTTVQLLSGGRTSSHEVVVGLRGDSRTQIISGLNAGQEVVVKETLPALGTSATTSGAGSSGTLGAGGFGGGGAGRLFGGGATRLFGGGFAGGG